MIPDPQAIIGQSFGGYYLDRLLGGGGMGLVYLAHEERDPAHIVAVKVLLPTWQMLATPGRDQISQRFLRDAELLRQLRYPHILKIFAAGEERGLLYLVLPYIAGKTLAERIKMGQLPLEEIIRIGGQIAEALAYAHSRGVIHRDIKPTNILFDSQENVYLADFGIAKLFDFNGTILVGTPGYMAPEQALGQSATAQSDQYSLGVLYYEMVTGRSLAQIRQSSRFPTPRDLRPELPEAASEAILRALKTEPEDRYPTVVAFVQAFAAGLSITALARESIPIAYSPVSAKSSPELSITTTSPQPTIVAPAPSPIIMTIPAPRPHWIASRWAKVVVISTIVTLILFTVLIVHGHKPSSSLAFHPTATPTPIPGILRWSYLTGGYVFSSPIVVNGTLYVGSRDHNVYALNASTGAMRWSYKTGGWVASSPTVVNGIIYVGSDDSKVYALNAINGDIRWSYTTGSAVDSSPTVVNDIVYVGSDDSKVYALDATSGAVIWSYQTGGPIYSSPTVANGIVYVGSWDRSVYALDASKGTVIWSFVTGGFIDASPTVANYMVYVGSRDDRVYALNAITGAIRWSYLTGNFVWSDSASENGIVYIGSNDHKMCALDAITGTLRWSYTTGNIVVSSPTVAKGVIYVGSDDHFIYALDAITGVVRWSYPTGSIVRSSPTVVNGIVYVGSYDNSVYALNA